MKSTEFCYFLQGVLEVSKPEILDVEQGELIWRHLNMVFAYDPNPLPFCHRLLGYLEIEGTGKLSHNFLVRLKKDLAQTFLNDIDPTYGDQAMQDRLSRIHQGLPFKPTLSELLPGEDVIEYDARRHPKPTHAGPNWKYSSLHGWYDPNGPIPKC